MIDKIKNLLRSRKQDYKNLFLGGDGELSVSGDRVLQDLSKFCHANESAFVKDERLTLVLLGRQEVFTRIQHHLNLDDAAMMKLYANIGENNG